ncbi:MAG: amidohydrolase family protein [Planctomycetes bacterium]|nr:amidohydrolase family protein [Planctomycetota bacterium]
MKKATRALSSARRPRCAGRARSASGGAASSTALGVSSPRGDGLSSNRTGIDFRHPPPRRLPCPLIDVHTHVGRPALAALFAEAARTYQVRRVFAISSFDDADALRRRYGAFFEFYYRLPFDGKNRPRLFRRLSLERIDEAVERGFSGIKFWFKPPFVAEQKLKFCDPLLYPVFEHMAQRGIPALVHMADPDVWFERVYRNTRRYGTKAQNYLQFTRVFRDFPNLTFIGAHLAGDPERLDHLQELLDEFPNLVMDCSATKWMARELSRQWQAAREFFIRNADRLLFGSDLVTFEGIRDFDRYASRYWVHQMLWETSVRCESPIDDLDSDGTPRIHGLCLPDEVLEKLYWRNAVRVFRIRRPPVSRVAAEVTSEHHVRNMRARHPGSV